MDRRTVRLAAISLSLGLALAGFPVTAGDLWTVDGSPSGGWVGKVIVDPATPTTLYATSGSGVYKSTDSGADWTLVFASLNGPDDLALDPLNPATLYVAYSGDSSKTMFKTTDGGATWNEMDSGIGTVENGTSIDFIFGITVDPVDEGTVYATSMNTGVYKTTDGGQHWSAINTGIESLIGDLGVTYRITVDPVDPQILYFGTEVTGPNGGYFSADSRSGLYRSADGGKSWTEVVKNQGFEQVTVNPVNDQLVYAGGAFLYTSTNRGLTWTQQTSSPVGEVNWIDPSNPLHMWGGGYTELGESTDGGSTWNPVNLGTGISISYNAAIVVDTSTEGPSTPAKLYAPTNWGMFDSVDDGVTWTDSTTGIHNVTVDLMVEGSDGIVYLASEGNGIYKSADQGATWAQAGPAGGPVTGSLPVAGDSVMSLVQEPATPSTLYAGTTQGIYMTTDGGDTWTETDTGVPTSGYTLALAIDPEAPTTLYAATNTDGAGVYKSVDGGTTWTASGNGLWMDPNYGGFQALAVDPHHSNVVYAGAFHSGLYKSTDGGATWHTDNGAIGVTDIWGIAVDPQDSNVVYTATSNGFYKSTDAGATWVESDYGLDGYWDMTNIVIDPTDTQIIYATQRYGIGDAYISPDAGYTWYDLSTLTPGTLPTATRSARRVSRGLERGAPGHIVRGAAPAKWTIGSAVMGPAHPDQLLGSANDGQVYSFSVKNLPKGGHPSSSGSGSGGGSATPPPKTPPASGSGGGGSFGGLGLGLLLAANALRRRKRVTT